MSLNDYRFDLPPELIAQEPPAERSGSRLMLVEPGRGPVGERPFTALPGLLRRGDLLVVNDSRVLPARLRLRRVDTGGQVEVLLLRPTDRPRTWSALARPARRLRPGQMLAGGRTVDGAPTELEVVDAPGGGRIEVRGAVDPAEIADAMGSVPLPPYIKRAPDDEREELDRRRYQTVYAAEGDEARRSVAAPTAGLHFSAETFAALAERGVAVARVRLHVGLGTFQAPDEDQWRRRRLHREWFHLPAATSRSVAETRRGGGRVIAVGTTALRVLATAARLGLDGGTGPDRRDWSDDDGAPAGFVGTAARVAGAWDLRGETRLFLAPPDAIDCVDGLLTNFHLPGSSLVMLVAALAGDPAWRRAYEKAVADRLRFYSYGDCMLVMPGLAEVE